MKLFLANLIMSFGLIAALLALYDIATAPITVQAAMTVDTTMDYTDMVVGSNDLPSCQSDCVPTFD